MADHATQPKSNRTALAALGLIALGALGSTTYLLVHQGELEGQTRDERAAKELAISQQRSAEERTLASNAQLEAARRDALEAQGRIGDLETRLRETDARAANLERSAGRNVDQARELASLRNAAKELRDELAMAREKELNLRTNLDRANADKEALAHQMNQREAIAMMVNNAALDAHKGSKGKLTVVARRTKEISLAFDLPETMARGANYRIIGPDGKEYKGAEPIVSKAKEVSEATASAGSMGKPSSKGALSRVELKFHSKERMKPGMYKVQVYSGTDHLQTLNLNLR